jgi:hypothetical protein
MIDGLIGGIGHQKETQILHNHISVIVNFQEPIKVILKGMPNTERVLAFKTIRMLMSKQYRVDLLSQSGNVLQASRFNQGTQTWVKMRENTGIC